MKQKQQSSNVRAVNAMVDKLVTIYTVHSFPGPDDINSDDCGIVVGKVIDVVAQGVTITRGDDEIVDHIPWENIRAIRHTMPLIASDTLVKSVTINAAIQESV